MWARSKNMLAVVILAAIGLAVSIAIETVHRRLVADASYASFCNISSTVNCDVVLGSRFASLAGVSVAVWAILYYLVLLGLAVGMISAAETRGRETLSRLAFVVVLWGVLFSFYLAGVALLVLHTICLMCSALYLVNIALFVSLWWLRSALRVESARRGARGRDRGVLIGSGVAVLLLIVIGGWEALGHGVHQTDATEIARERPDFFRWYLGQPVADVPVDDNHSRGNANAPVTIVEFSDFACGHCAAFHETLEETLPQLGQSVRVVFRHFPLDSSCNAKITGLVHQQACLAAVAAECAGEQGKFWPYHDLLFENQQELARQFLISYATRLRLDVARFTSCLGSAEPRARVERDARDGAALGIDSTPTVFINGRTIKGALDAQKLIDAVTLTQANANLP